MADELKIVISAQDNASSTFKKIADAAGKVADELEKAGKDGGKGFDELGKSTDKASASFAKLDSSGNGAIRVVGEAGSAARQASDSFIQMGTGLQTVAQSFSEWSQSARDQQQTMIGLRAAFGDTADEMIDFGKTLADSNKTIFNDDDIARGERYFATLKNNYDLTTEQIKNLMQVTADLATASGTTFEDASSRVTAAIRGEGEAAEYLGLTMNQQSIDRDNLTLSMTNQEAAQFRLNALNQQAAAYSGTAERVAQSSVGTYAAVTNQLQDMGQAVGGVVGPWASLASTLGSGLATVGEATRGIGEIKAGLTGLVGAIRNSSAAMSVLSVATGPVGLAIAGVGLALAGVAFLWDRHNKGAEEAKKAYEEYGKAVDTVEKSIMQQRLLGYEDLADRMEEDSNKINNALEQGVNNIDHLKEEMSGAWDALDEQITDSGDIYGTVTKFFNDGIGRAALDFAKSSGTITAEVYDQILGGTYMRENSAQYLADVKKIWDGYVDALQISDADKTKVQQNVNELFELMANPKIDQAKLEAGLQPILELLQAGKVDEANAAFAALFATLIAGAGTAGDAVNKLTYGLDGQLNILDSQAEKIKQIYKDIYEARTGKAFPEERVTEADVYAEQDIDKRAELAARLKQQRQQDMADEEQFYRDQEARDKERAQNQEDAFQAERDRQQKRYEDRKKQNDEFLAMQREAMDQDAKDREADRQRQRADAEKDAEAQKAIFEAREEAAKNAISQWMEMTGNDDFVSQLNLSGHGTEFTQLAGNIDDANTALQDGYRIIVQNTDAIGQNAQAVEDWANKLIGAQGEYGKIDDLLAAGVITQNEYNAAQQAQVDIATANAAIQQDILTIQAKQAPLLADLTEQQQVYMDQLAQMPADQQLITLGWMDATEAAKANQAVTMAAAAANGEYGASGQEAVEKMILAQAQADPIYKQMLLDIGLLEEKTDQFGNKTLSVNFEGAEGMNTDIQELTKSIDALTVALGGVPPLHIDTGNLPAVKSATDAVTAGFRGMGLASGEADAGAQALNATFADLATNVGDVLGKMGATAGAALPPVEMPVTPVIDGPPDLSGTPPVDVPATPVITGPPDLSGVPPVQIPAQLVLSAGGSAVDAAMGAAQSALGGVEDINVTVTATADVADAVIGLYNVQQQADTLAASNPTLTVTAELGSSQTDLDKLASTTIDDKHFAIFGDATVALAAVDNVNGAGVADKSMAIFGDASIALAAINNVNNTPVYDKTMTINVVTAYSTTGTKPTQHGGLLHYATGGLIPHIAGEGNRPEMAHYANGGMAILPTEGLYFNPPNTYISPAPANPGIGGGGFTVNFNGNFYGSNRAEMDAWARDSLIPQFRDELLNHQRSQGVVI